MLGRISITNYLLIDQLDLDLQEGLTILTGETGSGKSILLGALSLAMGERAEAGLARDPRKRCVIEVELNNLGEELVPWFEESSIPWDSDTIVRRVLEPNGRSRGFINDVPVRLEQMRDLGARSIHIHSQHHTLLLRDRSFMLSALDMVAGIVAEVDRYGKKFERYRTAKAQLQRDIEEEEKSRNELDFFNFQLTELEEAQLVDGEFNDLEQRVLQADHADALLQALSQINELLSGEGGATERIERAATTAREMAPVHAELAQAEGRLKSTFVEVTDIVRGLEQVKENIEVDPTQAQFHRERLDLLQHLLHKHHKESIKELLQLQQDLANELHDRGSLAERIEIQKKEVDQVLTECEEKAERISKERVKVITSLEKGLAADLKALGMPHGQVKLEHSISGPGLHGIDEVRTLFSANKDHEPVPLEKSASGGESSRLMLALISRTASSKGSRTVVFDEIDTGVSGNVAEKVGELMVRMARERQLIAITHLPQIASKADQHLLVSKEEHNNGVHTSIRQLDKKERVQAIAAMLSGKRTSKAALENARVLLEGS